MSILIKNGLVVTSTGSYPADVYVEGEKIKTIGSALDQSFKADEIVDAKGKYVLPGAIDPHTHLAMPFMGLGVFIGGLASARAARRAHSTVERGPNISPLARLILALGGGVLAGNGAVARATASAMTRSTGPLPTPIRSMRDQGLMPNSVSVWRASPVNPAPRI